MWWGGRGQSFNIAPQKEEPEMGLSGPKSNPGNRMPEPSSHQLGSCLASGCLPGEHILAWAPGRRKGPGLDLPGTLICTNFRVTFQPCGWQRKQDTPLSSENDFALINIGRLEAVSGLSRVQLLRPGSQLKFIPEELLLHGRDFRLLRVGFEAGGLAPQAFQVTMAIIQARAQSSQVQQYRGITLSKVVFQVTSGSLIEFWTVKSEEHLHISIRAVDRACPGTTPEAVTFFDVEASI